MNETRSVVLGDALEALIDHRGKTPKKLGGDWSQRGVRVVSAKNIKNGRVTDDPIRYVNPALRDKWMPVPLKAGDVLLTSEAPLGEVAFLDEEVDWCLGQRLFALRGKPDVLDGRYLYFLLQYEPARHDVLNRATGTTASGIRQNELVKVRLDLPPITVQRQIAETLGALDDKHRSDRRQQSLVAQLLRAKFSAAVGRSSSWIPFDSIATLTKGVSYRTGDLASSRTALVTLKSFDRNGGYQARGLKPYVGKFKPEQEVRPGELAVALTDLTQSADVVGRVVRVPAQEGFDTLVASLDLTIVRPKEDVPPEYIYGVMLEEDFREHCRARATGTTVLHLASDALPKYRVPEVSSSVQRSFAAEASPLLERLDALNRELATLESLRTALIPGLLSGALRVAAASREPVEAGQ